MCVAGGCRGVLFDSNSAVEFVLVVKFCGILGVSEVICCRSVLSKNLGISLVIIPCKVVGALGLDPFGGCNVHTSISVVEELRLMIVLKVYFLIALVGGCYGTEAGQGQ